VSSNFTNVSPDSLLGPDILVYDMLVIRS